MRPDRDRSSRSGNRSMNKLAIDGGSPVRTSAMHSWPFFDSDEIAAVERVLRSGKVNYWTGEEGRQFEIEFASSCKVSHAVALSNGTIALEFVLRAFGIGSGDEVIVTPRSFVASASVVSLVGAKPVFAEVDPDSQNITARSIEAVISARTRAIIPVHLAGWPCDMDSIMDLSEKRGLKVIEDCAQAHGAEYKDRPVGSIGHVGAWSFCQDKIMTTGGEGGMITTNDPEVWRRVWEFKDHGKSWDAVYERNHPVGFRWVHESIGTNGRMTELQAAIGRIQLRKLSSWRTLRTQNVENLTSRLGMLRALRIPMPSRNLRHAWYKFLFFLRPEYLNPGWTRDRIVSAIAAEGIPAFSGFCPEIYLEKAFDNQGVAQPARFPVAKRLGETSLMVLIHPTLTKDEVDDTATAIEKVMAIATNATAALVESEPGI
jgi:dTDP-4-amino-4,6-dideoxygalactose transaminase